MAVTKFWGVNNVQTALKQNEFRQEVKVAFTHVPEAHQPVTDAPSHTYINDNRSAQMSADDLMFRHLSALQMEYAPVPRKIGRFDPLKEKIWQAIWKKQDRLALKFSQLFYNAKLFLTARGSSLLSWWRWP